MMHGLATEATVPKTVMIDATYLKAHRTASSLRSKKRGAEGLPVRHSSRRNRHLLVMIRERVLTLECIEARHPHEHPKIVADLLRRAVLRDGSLRNILTDPKLLRSPYKPQNIAQKVNEFCRKGAKRSSRQIIKDADLLSVEKIEHMPSQSHRCPKPRPEGWDFRLQLPAHLRGESLQSSSAYNKRPEVHAEIEHSKCSVPVETRNALHTTDDEEDVDAEMTLLSALAA